MVAPFTGIVQEKRVGPGTYVTVGQPVVKLVRIDPLRFEATVPEREVRTVKLGEPLTMGRVVAAVLIVAGLIIMNLSTAA